MLTKSVLIHDLTSLRTFREEWQTKKSRVAFVPTMGSLHQGHLSLVDIAKTLAEHVVVSIFVNPLQFAPHEDFAQYPRQIEKDFKLLEERGVNVVYAPTVEQIYPNGQQAQTLIEVPTISKILCGVSRPHFFQGVTTVVCKLLNSVRPHFALFGQKDYQQLMVIKRMVSDLCIPTEIIGAPIVREADGLAMSSRNIYLSLEERSSAPMLYKTLLNIRDRIQQGAIDIQQLLKEANESLLKAGFKPDYIEIYRAADLTAPQLSDEQWIVLGAVWLGKTRLIDNVLINFAGRNGQQPKAD